jgi:hypothetical protein
VCEWAVKRRHESVSQNKTARMKAHTATEMDQKAITPQFGTTSERKEQYYYRAKGRGDKREETHYKEDTWDRAEKYQTQSGRNGTTFGT